MSVEREALVNKITDYLNASWDGAEGNPWFYEAAGEAIINMVTDAIPLAPADAPAKAASDLGEFTMQDGQLTGSTLRPGLTGRFTIVPANPHTQPSAAMAVNTAEGDAIVVNCECGVVEGLHHHVRGGIAVPVPIQGAPPMDVEPEYFASLPIVDVQQQPSAATAVNTAEGVNLSQFNGHTPGPWEVESMKVDGERYLTYCVQDSQGRTLFDCLNADHRITTISVEYDEDGATERDEQGLANLTLAAAAPELLAEVKRLRASPPASASMSAGVTPDMEKAAIEAFYGSSDLPNFTQRLVLALDASERARANTRAGVDADSIENNEDWLDRVAQSIRDCLDGETVIDAENVAFAIQYANTCMNTHTVCLERTAGDAKGTV